MGHSRSTSWSNRTAWWFLAPFGALFLVFTVWPLASSLSLALKQTFGPDAERFVGGDNFVFLFHDPLFWRALRNTAIFAGGSVLLQTPLSLALALLLNRPQLRGRAVFRLIFFSPCLVGPVFVGLLSAMLFEKRTGFINATLHLWMPSFDPDFPWLERHAMWALLLTALWLCVGFNMLYFLAALQSVPSELMEAAHLDGAGPWSRFRQVTLPHIAPVTSLVTLLSLIGSFQLFELPWIMLNNSPGPQGEGLTLVMYMYQTGFLSGDLGYASAIGWVLGLLLIGLVVIQRTLVARKELG